MKFKDYLQDDRLEFIEILKKDCKLYMDIWSKQSSPICFFSGRDITIEKYYEMPVRKNRKPRNIFPTLHKNLDDIFYDLFKIRGRSQALFASADKVQVNIYGNPYIVIPKGKFEIIWSPKIHDLYSALIENFLRSAPIDELKDFIKANYKKGNIIQALKSYNEVMIKAESVYLVNPRFIDCNELLKLYKM